MSDVTCSRCGNSAPGLERSPLPGAVGQALVTQTCRACWDEWLGAQVILINERALTPANPEHYDLLVREMSAFLNLRDVEGTPARGGG